MSDPDPPTVYVVRNEPDPDSQYHCDALASWFPTATEVDFVAGDEVPLDGPDGADGVVLSGSTAGVYEAESRPVDRRSDDARRALVDREIPTLGVCFGHQVANAALGGTVEEIGTTADLVAADLDDCPIFDGVDPVVVSLHGDAVTEVGEGLEVIASADHAQVFGTRHRTAPLWTVQFHPEITADHRERLTETFDWSPEADFEDVTPGRVFENFERLVVDYAETTSPTETVGATE
jgi:GMP synthase - Glutamine amidotransferase domain